MFEFRCRNCGGSQADLHEFGDVEILTEGWRKIKSVEITDGKLEIVLKHFECDTLWDDDGFYRRQGWRCAKCQTEADTFEELAESLYGCDEFGRPYDSEGIPARIPLSVNPNQISLNV